MSGLDQARRLLQQADEHRAAGKLEFEIAQLLEDAAGKLGTKEAEETSPAKKPREVRKALDHNGERRVAKTRVVEKNEFKGQDLTMDPTILEIGRRLYERAASPMTTGLVWDNLEYGGYSTTTKNPNKMIHQYLHLLVKAGKLTKEYLGPSRPVWLLKGKSYHLPDEPR